MFPELIRRDVSDAVLDALMVERVAPDQPMHVLIEIFGGERWDILGISAPVVVQAPSAWSAL